MLYEFINSIVISKFTFVIFSVLLFESICHKELETAL